MKFFYLCIILFSLFISCDYPSEVASQSAIRERTAVIIDTVPINKGNLYDAAGQVHHQLLTEYYQSSSLPFTLNGIITSAEGIANVTPSFMDLTKEMPYSFVHADRVATIISAPPGLEEEIVNASLVSSEARSSFTAFFYTLLQRCETEQEFGVLYDFIVSYEDAVQLSSSLPDVDKKTILITTSIARHTVYARKKKPKKDKDPEWQYMVGNIIAALDGADDSMADAVMKGLVTGIAENRSF
ncbi:hypothetical protein [Flavobacterium sedimenticola]|uniref:DUF4136 domain-containing protein n=1 Tax=Flavobacterium sedimenticola TaxID=3043286 RepID=A0ABT6XS57_9FLAO|nr:hypothetical protein [Flavobacterium sedimenticola]MDI9257937.1 hypothetical protein [Flavobacterium sedimenticola]